MGFLDFNILDLIDIIVVALLFYQLYRMIRGTAAMTIFIGIVIVYVLWIVVRALNMELFSSILGRVIDVGVLAIIIVFQQEIRRYLLLLGTRFANNRNRFIRRLFHPASKAAPAWSEDVAKACVNMASSCTGALICIERSVDISSYAAAGELIEARIGAPLLENIFFKNSPLHDGAVIIRGGTIYAARCVLPSTDNPNIPNHLGMRHRAALGLSEHADAVILVVSEERGTISIAQGGAIERIIHTEKLGQYIDEALSE